MLVHAIQDRRELRSVIGDEEQPPAHGLVEPGEAVELIDAAALRPLCAELGGGPKAFPLRGLLIRGLLSGPNPWRFRQSPARGSHEGLPGQAHSGLNVQRGR